MQKIAEYLSRVNSTHWALGCAECKFGIVSAPNILTVLPFYEERAGQAHEGMIIFCDCRAGHMYRQGLRKIYNSLSMETRRNVLAHISAASVPTVHRVTPSVEMETSHVTGSR